MAKAGRSCAASAGKCGWPEPCGAAAGCASPASPASSWTRSERSKPMTIQFPFGLSFGLGIAVIVAIFLFASIRILREYERGVVFFLGRFHSVKGPGLIIIIPMVQQMVRVDLRTRVFDVPPQDVITRD